MNDDFKIKGIIISQENFHLLPRDSDGYCIHKGDLFCNSYELSILPDNLIIKGSLYCNNNNLKKLPNNLKVRGILNCTFNKLTSLPDNLYVGRNLYCGYNKLVSLPSGLIIGGFLDCTYNNITKVIKSRIRGDVFMDDKQQRIYDRILKMDKLKNIIDG